MNKGLKLTGAALAVSMLAAAQPATAKTIKMVAVSAAPPIVTYVRAAKNHIMPEINRRIKAAGIDFEIEWTGAYSQSLAKFSEVFDSVEEGIAHMCLCLKNFEPSSLPLEQYLYSAPFGTQNREQVVAIDDAVRAKIPQMNEAMLKHNQVYLASAGSSSSQLFTKFPVKRYEDVHGHKLGASGSMGHWLRGTGAVVVNANMAASYTDIKNGLYEGYPIAVTLAFPYKTYEAAKYATVINFGVTATSFLTVNRDTWDNLPSAVRKIFREVASEYNAAQAKIDGPKTAKFMAIMKKKGVKFSTMEEKERRRWALAMPNIAQEWAKSVDKKGQPGTAVLKAFMDEMRARKISIARQWDRE